MASVHDVAAFLLAEHGQMGALKLQKLVYYSQAWSIVWDGQPIFPEWIVAWDRGPVVRELYEQHRGMPFVDRLELGDPSKLSEAQRATIRAVIDFYGQRDEWWLSELTHREPPWIEARATGQRNPPITTGALRAFYSTYAVPKHRIPDAVARGLDLLARLPPDAVDDVLRGTPVEVHGLEEWLETGKGNPWATFGD